MLHALPFQRLLFRLHWLAGLSAGLVLAVVGITGGLLGLAEPILALANPGLRIEADGRAPLAPEQWVASARAALPQHAPRALSWNGDGAAVGVRMAQGTERGVELALDPYDGRVLGLPRGTDFFAAVERLHRTLAVGPIGKQVVGASTVVLVGLALSGLALRWRRRPKRASAWLRLDLRLRGRALLWQLHAVAGTWLLAFYLIAALTGLWWSYDGYRGAVNRLAGVTTPLRRPAPPPLAADAPIPPLEAAWAAFRRAVPDATRANLALSADAAAPLEIRYQTAASPHERAWDSLKVDATDGRIVGHERYAELPRGRRFVAALFPLHSGSFLGAPGRTLMALAALLMPLFAITGYWLWLARRRATRGAAPSPTATRTAGAT